MDHPAQVLLDTTDPRSRSRAHTSLGERAIARQDFDTAETHLREAIDLDPTDERPKRLLGDLPREPRGGRLAGWFRGWRR